MFLSDRPVREVVLEVHCPRVCPFGDMEFLKLKGNLDYTSPASSIVDLTQTSMMEVYAGKVTREGKSQRLIKPGSDQTWSSGYGLAE